jgi:hypothetical protein
LAWPNEEIMNVTALLHQVRLLGIPQNSDRYLHYSDGIIIEDCWDIFRRKLIGSVTDEKTGFPNGTIANDHTPATLKSALLVQDTTPPV